MSLLSDSPAMLRSVAIQGEHGSNSHMAALEMLGPVEVVPCSVSAEVFEAVLQRRVDGAVIPIENSLHGSVAEHYDLLLEHPVRITQESLLRVRHNLIVVPGVSLSAYGVSCRIRWPCRSAGVISQLSGMWRSRLSMTPPEA